MAGQSPGLTKAFIAVAAISAHRIVALAAADDRVQAAANGNDDAIGVTTEIGAAADETVDVCLDGIRDVQFGGAVGRGKFVMAGPDGKAVLATAAAGANVRYVGYTLFQAADGDIGPIKIQPGMLQGA